MSTAIEVKDLTKKFGNYEALKEVSFSVPAHSVVGFLGPNGAGKTTTLRILTGLSRATSGEVKLLGKAVTFGDQKGFSEIGYLPEQPAIYPWMNSVEYLQFIGGLTLKGEDLKKRIAEVLSTVGLHDARKRRVGGYSNGMKQRLGIAQAILANPKILIFDEPVSALDPIGRREVLQLMKTLQKDHTILFSSHILSDVEKLCHEVIIINKGKVVTQATVSELKKRFMLPLVRIQFGRALTDSEMAQIKKIQGVENIISTDAGLEISTAADFKGNILWKTLATLDVDVVSYGVEQPELEDIFVNLIKENV